MQILERNIEAEEQAGVPDDFPLFIRQAFRVKVVGDNYQIASDG